MKRLMAIVLGMLLLTGCTAAPAMETVADVPAEPVSAGMQQILLELPKDAVKQTLGPDSTEQLYLCDGFTVCLQTLDAGDLDRTLRTATGYGKEELALMQTASVEGKRYRCVWAAAGEGQTQVGKTCIVDDGSYHYVLTVMVPEESAGKLAKAVSGVMDSFQVVDADFSTGS